MILDSVDDILAQWSGQRPELDTASLGVVIRVMGLYKTFQRQATQALEPLGLELFEYDVLSALRRQGAPYSLQATAIANETGLSTGATTNRIDRLEARGLVRRKRDKNDRRGVTVLLTPTGRKVIDEAIGLRLEAADHGLRSMNKKDTRELVTLLRKLQLASEA